MATVVIMPRQGQSVESCIIGEWHKKKGDRVEEGDILFTYETDKATFDEAAKVSGMLLGVFFEEGDDVPVLTNVCVIGEPGEDISEFLPSDSQSEDGTKTDSQQEDLNSSGEKASDAPILSGEKAQVVSQSAEVAPDGVSAPVSPRARAYLKKHNVDLRFAEPSGAKGRIMEQDLIKAAQAGHIHTSAVAPDYPADLQGTGVGGRVRTADIAGVGAGAKVETVQAVPAVKTQDQPVTTVTTEDQLVFVESIGLNLPSSKEEKHTNIRKIIGKSMHESLSNMAQLTMNTSFDATDILGFREKVKKAVSSGMAESLGLGIAQSPPTINDIVLYAVSRVLKNHKSCNAHYYDDRIVYFDHVNLGVAVDTPRGLMVPTIFGADLMNIAQISNNSKILAKQCIKGTISPDYLTNGTITVTNLGTLGIESFTPVINPPQTCILGVNTIVTGIREVNGEIVPYKSMGLSLTFDHRALDGAPAARFLKELTVALENFSLLITG